MKYSAQVIYPEFVEIFDIELDNNSLDINLKKLDNEPSKSSKFLTLDLSSDVKENYSVFPFEKGDLSIIQIKNQFVGSYINDSGQHWFRVSFEELISFLSEKDITSELIPFLDEDKAILTNALFCDLLRNDFSFTDLNKKVKFLKTALLVSFIHKNVQIDYKRVLLDETFLGDVEIDQVVMAFKYSDMKVLKLVKIDNLSKILVLLEKNNLIDRKYHFISSTLFINNPKDGEKVKLIFGDSGIKFDYQVLPNKNYVFDMADKEYLLNVGNVIRETVKGKVFVFNGDNRDLMIS